MYLKHYMMRNLGKGPYAIREQRRSRWACASVQSDLDILCSSTYTTVSIDSVCEQHRLWSACASAQADQSLCSSQITYGPFSCVRVSHVLSIYSSLCENQRWVLKLVNAPNAHAHNSADAFVTRHLSKIYTVCIHICFVCRDDRVMVKFL